MGWPNFNPIRIMNYNSQAKKSDYLNGSYFLSPDQSIYGAKYIIPILLYPQPILTGLTNIINIL